MKIKELGSNVEMSKIKKLKKLIFLNVVRTYIEKIVFGSIKKSKEKT